MATTGHLSGSTDGRIISVTATSTPGTTVHTAIAATDQIDHVYLYAVNNHTAAVEIEVEWGDTTATTNIVQTIPTDSGKVNITDKNGDPIQNSQVLSVFAGTTAVIGIGGSVLRSTTAEAHN